MNSAFAQLNPFNQVGLVPGTGPDATRSSTQPGLAMVAPVTDDHPPVWHPDNGLFWLGGILAVTLGLIAVSTSVKVGPFQGSFSAGGK